MVSFVSGLVMVFLADRSIGPGASPFLATTTRATPKPSAATVSAHLNQFIAMMKSLSSRETAPYQARLFPEDPKADLTRLLGYVGDEGIEFINLTNEGVTREHPTTIRRVRRDQLAAQIKKRRGEQLLWLMEFAHFLKWWRDRPDTIERPDSTKLLVTFTDNYILTFREQPDRLLLVKVENLDAGGD